MKMLKSNNLNFLFQALLCFFLLAGNQLAAQTTNNIGENSITTELMKQHIYYLASDAMKGRKTPSAELDSAAAYIAANFKKNGLQSINNSYFQIINLCQKNLGDGNAFQLIKDGKTVDFALKTDYVPFEMTAEQDLSSKIVFAGYGITAPEYKYDDYSNIDVKDKIVLILKHEPGENDPKSIFDGTQYSKYANLKSKIDNAYQHGAKGILLFTDPLNHMLYTPQGYPWAALSKYLSPNDVPIEMCDQNKPNISVVQIGEEVVNQLFGSVAKLKAIQQKMDSTLISQSFEFPNATIHLKTVLKFKNFTTSNVVGFLEGSDPILKKELIVVGGHYDHVGIDKMMNPGTDFIYNGADDNASGTAAVMSIAEAFAKAKVKSKRSILFICFTGEEKGLYGSRFYCANPLFPLENTVAMINLDMISRNDSDVVEIHGEKYSPDLTKIIVNQNSNNAFKIKYPGNDYFERSDQYNFFKKNVPALFLSSGDHKDYHKVTDNPENTDCEKAARIAKLAFRTINYISNDNKRYTIIKH